MDLSYFVTIAQTLVDPPPNGDATSYSLYVLAGALLLVVGAFLGYLMKKDALDREAFSSRQKAEHDTRSQQNSAWSSCVQDLNQVVRENTATVAECTEVQRAVKEQLSEHRDIVLDLKTAISLASGEGKT